MPDTNVSSTTLSSPEFKQMLASLFAYLVKHLGIKEVPLVKLINSKSNADDPFGMTGHYDPEKRLIAINITDRHDTDILRTFAHEIIHHWQNLNGTLHPTGTTHAAAGHYAQNDEHLRKREMEAYLFGNILFRDWQDEQRMGPPKVQPLMPQPIQENLSIANPEALRQQTEQFVNTLIQSGTLSSYHRERTSGDMNPADFAGDITHKILSAIEELFKTVDNRGDWENDEGGMIKEVVCKKCGKGCDYANIREVCMGAIKCPHCNTTIDQEGKFYE